MIQAVPRGTQASSVTLCYGARQTRPVPLGRCPKPISSAAELLQSLLRLHVARVLPE
jgi:hypothetical protein